MTEGHALIAEPPTPTATEPTPVELQYLDLKVGQTYKVIVSYAESPYVVWCQRTEYQTEFDHLMNGMVLKYANPSQMPSLSNPAVDCVCAMLYTCDQSWCRGVIQNIDKSSKTAQVLFVDFGNTETLKLSELKELLPEFLTLPAQAISFSMEGISPRGGSDDWSPKAIAEFQELTVERGLLCKVVGLDQDGYPAAHLLDPTASNKDIGLEMVRLGLAEGPVMAPKSQISSSRGAPPVFSSNHVPQSSSCSSTRSDSKPGSQSGSHPSSQSGIPHHSQTSQFHSQTQKTSPFHSQKSTPGGSPYHSPKPPRDISYTQPRIGSGQAYDVFVSQVNSPSDFYCQLQSSAVNVDNLSVEIEKHCSSPEARTLVSVHPGMSILAQFSEDQCWYRALIKATPASDKCTVAFVDFGNSETVQLTSTRELPLKLINLPAQAFRCTLFGFPADCGPEATSLFSDLVLEDGLRCFVKSTSKGDELPLHSVELATSKKVNVLEALTTSMHKSSTPQRAVAVIRKTPPVPRIPANSNIDVCISFVETPGKFYVQLTESYTTLDRLTEGLQETYQNRSSRKERLPKPEVGAFCCTQFSEDQVWYRARITALHGSESEVLYIDYGNSERVKNSDLLVLENQFAADPALAVPCTFEGLSSAVLNSLEMGEKLSELTLEKTLVAQFARPLSSLDDCVPVKIIDTSNPGSDVNVAESLQSGTGTQQSGAGTQQHTGMEIALQKVKLGLPLACIVAFAISPDEFYCQLVSESEKLDDLMNTMYTFYAEQNAGSAVQPPSLGTFCAAPFSDGSWYRSKITKMSAGAVTLFYADYGNVEEIPACDIRSLESQFCRQPIQALRCSLNGISPIGNSWSEEACSMFQAAVVEEEMRVSFLREVAGGYEVEVEFREQDIAQKLVDAGLARRKTVTAAQSGDQLIVPALQLEQGANYDVMVTTVNSPLDFYCHITDPEGKLDVLMDQIDRHCSTASAPSDRSYKPGEFVLARFTEDKGWYRAVVTEGGGPVEVRYVDYGNAEMVAASELRLMAPAFCRLPGQAVWCRLVGVEHYSLSEDAMASLNELLLNSEFQLRCVSIATPDHYAVDLIRKEDGVSLTNHAIELGIVQSKADNRPHPPAPPQGLDQASIVIPTSFPQVEPDSFHDVVVVHGESPDMFYCQFSVTAEKLDALMNQMQTFYATNQKEPPAKCAKGTFLAAQFSQDQLWYRAQVCEDTAEGVGLYFVDYGNWEVVPRSRLQYLVPEFATLPSQAIPCQLVGVTPQGDSWSEEAIDGFLEIVLEQTLVAQTRSAPESGQAFTFGDGQKLKLSLIDSSGEGELVAVKLTGAVVADSSPVSPEARSPRTSTASSSRTKLNENLIEAGSQHEVYVSHLISPGAFWLQLAATEEALALLSNRLTAVYDSSEVTSLDLKEPETGMSCCARFSEDRSWYRGVVRSVSPTGCLVYFVDYGNSETVAPADIKFLKPEFLDLQIQAIKCSLVGCHPENQSDEAITCFSGLVLEKLLIAEFMRGSAEQWEVSLYYEGIDIAASLTELGVMALEKTDLSKETVGEAVEGSPGLPAADLSKETVGEAVEGSPGLPAADLSKETVGGAVEGSPGLPAADLSKETVGGAVEGSPGLPAADPGVLPAGGAAEIPGVKLMEGDTYDVFVTHTVLPTEFYCQMVSNVEALETLMAQVADYYNSSQPAMTAVQVGAFCIAQYSGNNAWYRAKIIDVADAITVHFVDYGNCEAVSSANILALRPDFASLPSQAICCSLTPNIAHPFTDEKLEEFFSLNFEQQFRIKITGHQQSLYFVNLLDTVGTSVNELLLSETDELEETSAFVVPGGRLSYVPLQYTTGASIDVYISFVASPTCFYCQPLELAGELDAMMTQLAAAVTTVPLDRLENITPGDVCLAQYSADSEWYRASVVTVPLEGKALVNFVDYGNSEVVDMDVITPLPAAFVATKLQAIRCSVFQDVGAEMEWSEEKIEAFQGLVGEDQNYTITVKGVAADGRYVVAISSNGHAIDFSHLLEQETVPITVETLEEDVPIPSSSFFRPIPTDDLVLPLAAQGVNVSMLSNDPNEISMASVMAVKGSKTPSTEVETESENGGEGELLIRAPFKLSLAVQEVLEASVVFVQSPSMLYIQRTDCQGELDALAVEIEQYCASFPDKQFQPGFHPGDFVLAKYAVDDSWYRAEVVEVQADSTVEVRFIDYGNMESISPDSLIMCPENFLDLPAQAIPCSLAHVPRRESWPSEYKELIDGLVEGEILRATVVLPASLGMRPTITLENMESGTEISNQVLMKLQEECDLGASTLSDDVIIEEREELEGEIPDDREPPTGDDVTPHQVPPGLRKLTLPGRNFEIGMNHEVFIASCQSPHSFLCQLTSETETLDSITTQLAQTYAGSDEEADQHLLESVPEEGDFLCAQFSEDKQWYRAQVLGGEGNEFEVLYIDFGNSEVLSLASLRGLDENLASYPPMAFECFLSGVESPTGDGQFDQTAAEKMLELIGEGAATMEIVSTDTAGHLGVTLTSSEGVNIGTSLIEVGLASQLLETPLTTPSTATLQSSHSTEIAAVADTPKAADFEVAIPESEDPIPVPDEVTVPEGTKDSPVGVSLPESDEPIPVPVIVPDTSETTVEYATSYPDVTISPGTRFQVTVASVSSPDNFTCQTLTEGVEELARGLAAEGYSIGMDSLTVQAPCPGLPVCACFTRDSTWYRAKITSIGRAPNTISVEYVDSGYSEAVSLERVKYLKKVFASVHPPRALHCSLQLLTERDLGPSAPETEDPWELVWPLSCSGHLVELTRDKEEMAIEVTGTNEDGNFIVKLMDTSGDVDVDIREVIIAKLREPKALPPESDISDDEFHDALDIETELQLDEVGAGKGGGAVVDAQEVDDEEDSAVEGFHDASDVMEEIQPTSPAAGDSSEAEPLVTDAEVSTGEPPVGEEGSTAAVPSVTPESLTTARPSVAEEGSASDEFPIPEEDAAIPELPVAAEGLMMKEPVVVSMAEPTIATTDSVTVEPPEDLTTAEPPNQVDSTMADPHVAKEDSATAESPESLTTAEPPEDLTPADPPLNQVDLTMADSPVSTEDSTTAEPPEDLTTPVTQVDSTVAEPPVATEDSSTVEPPEDLITAEPPEDLTTAEPPEDLTTVEPPENLTTAEPPEDLTTAEPPENLTTAEPPVDLTTAEPPVPRVDAGLPVSDVDPTMAIHITAPSSQQSEDLTAGTDKNALSPLKDKGSVVSEPPVIDEHLTVAEGSLAEQSEVTDTEESIQELALSESGKSEVCAALPEEKVSHESSVPDSLHDLAAAAVEHEKEKDTVAVTEASVEPTPTDSAPCPHEPLPLEPLPQEPQLIESPLAVDQTTIAQDKPDVSRDPGTGDADGAPPVSPIEPPSEGMEPKQGEEGSYESGSTSEQTLAMEGKEEAVPETERKEEGVETVPAMEEEVVPEGEVVSMPLMEEAGGMVSVPVTEGEEGGVVSVPVTEGGMVNVPVMEEVGGVVSVPVTEGGMVNVPVMEEVGGVVSVPVTEGGMVSVSVTEGGMVSVPVMEGGMVNVPVMEEMGGVVSVPVTEGGVVSVPVPVPVTEMEEGGMANVPAAKGEKEGVKLPVMERKEEGVETMPVTEGKEEGVETMPVTEGKEEGVETMPVTEGKEEGVETMPVTEGKEEGVETMPVTEGKEEGVETMPVTEGKEEGVETMPVTEGKEEGVETMPVSEGKEEGVETMPVSEGKEEGVETMTEGKEEGVETMPVIEGKEEGVETMPVSEGKEEGVETMPVIEGKEEGVETMTEGKEEGVETIPVTEGVETHPQTDPASKKNVPSDSEGQSPVSLVSVYKASANE